MAKQITQVITQYPIPPNSETDNSTEFNAKADAYVAHQVTNVPEVNTWATQANEVATDISNASDLAYKWAENPEDSEVETGKYSAKHWATKAEETVATIPVGTIDDSIITTTNTFSSQRIAEIGGRKNFLMNGGMQVWQRGTGTVHNGYTADRWKIQTGSKCESGIVIPNKKQIWFRNTDVANKGTWSSLQNTIEDGWKMSGKTVTLSFLALFNIKSGEEYPFLANEDSSWNIDLAFDGDNAIEVGVIKRYKWTFTIPTTPVGQYIVFRLHGTAEGTPDFSIYITEVQFELGEVATDFEYVHIAEELARCQRYYNIYTGLSSGYLTSATAQANASILSCFLTQNMRTIPTTTLDVLNTLNINNVRVHTTKDNYIQLAGDVQTGGTYSAWNIKLTCDADY